MEIILLSGLIEKHQPGDHKKRIEFLNAHQGAFDKFLMETICSLCTRTTQIEVSNVLQECVLQYGLIQKCQHYQ